MSLLLGEIADHQRVVAASGDALRDAFDGLARACTHSLRTGGKLLLFGNGGSAADAQHIAAELVGRFQAERRPLPALALTTDSSALTAIANDFGYDYIFERQVEALAQPSDIVIGISTSGNSHNVVRGLYAARLKGCLTAALTGESGGDVIPYAVMLLSVPSTITARIQEVHILIGHALCLAIERGLAE